MLNVTKTYLPPFEEYTRFLKKIWESHWVTNRGPLVLELEARLKDYLGVQHLLYVANGTLALQIAIKALDLRGEIITTPFSYAATTTSILWEGCQPVFVDIEPCTFCIDPDKIEQAITEKTSAILAVHVYGYPCHVEKIRQIAQRYRLKVIYDAAHAFGVKINDTSVLNFGDISILSFHATKLFHTIEGGAMITQNAELAQQIDLYHRFGHTGDEYYTIGINAKSSELHAAMGLCVLPKVDAMMARRNKLIALYDQYLRPLKLQRPAVPDNLCYNGAYYPVVFPTEIELLCTKEKLAAHQIHTRRYFYPALNMLPYISPYQKCVNAEDIAPRVLCLPLYTELTDQEIESICRIIKNEACHETTQVDDHKTV